MQDTDRNKETRIKEFKDLMGGAFSYSVHDINDIVEKLGKLGFFTAPASTKFHGAYEGGIVRPLFSGNGRACEPHGKARA